MPSDPSAPQLAVVDTGVFVAGVFWRSEPHRVLKAVRLGFLLPVLSESIFAEYQRQRVLARVKLDQGFTTELSPWLELMHHSALWVTTTPLGKKVCRDPKDDQFIEAAEASGARLIIARDPDLTVLEKPYGIEMLTPRAWLAPCPAPCADSCTPRTPARAPVLR